MHVIRHRPGGSLGFILGALLALVAALALPAAAGALTIPASLPHQTGLSPRPGPAILYRAPATAPQLTNAGIWRAAPILVSGAVAYRRGEFLYQDFLDDDHGAHGNPDPNNPMTSGDLFSGTNGSYTYPTAAAYGLNAADLVEFRVKPTRTATAFRITLNTLIDPRLIAFSIGLASPGNAAPAGFPFGANVRAPAQYFLTVRPQGSRLVADFRPAGAGAGAGAGKAGRIVVKLDRRRRQIEVDLPHAIWNPRARKIRMWMGVGLWDAARGAYLLPGTSATATQPGGAPAGGNPAAFFNVAFRTHEPLPAVTDGLGVVTNPAWWRDRQQATALARNDISDLSALVDFRRLLRRQTDNAQVPTTGAIDRILASHFETKQGIDFSGSCGLNGASKAPSCQPAYFQRLQPYAIYVPAARQPAGGYGLTLLLHSLSANYNQYSGSHNQSQFAGHGIPSIVITPEGRGPDLFYEGMGAADTFEVWNDVAHHYRLNPAQTDITGYSMGGFGTFKLGAQFPDLFARAQPTVGEEANTDLLASFRNLPVLMWNNASDELVPAVNYEPDASQLASLGYRYELDVYEPCPAAPNATQCSPLFPNHLELAVNDQYAPAAMFLGTAPVPVNPTHVTYVYDTARDRPSLGVVANHVYWVSGLALRSSSHTDAKGDSTGEINVVSHGFGTGDPTATSTGLSTGSLTGGNLGALTYAASGETWGAAPSAPSVDTLDLTATNLASATIDVTRAKVDCNVHVNLTSDGPITVKLLGCSRTVHGG